MKSIWYNKMRQLIEMDLDRELTPQQVEALKKAARFLIELATSTGHGRVSICMRRFQVDMVEAVKTDKT